MDAALAVADRAGFDAVSMRAVAAEIGAAPMSIYRHVTSKNDLLDAMLDGVVERFAPSFEKTWEAKVEAMARRARTLILGHPAWMPLFTRVTVPSSALGVLERLLTVMDAKHLPRKGALDSVSALIAFTLGSVLVERMMRDAGGKPIPIEQVRSARTVLSKPRVRRSYPRLARATREYEDWSFDLVFDVGLKSLLRGLRSGAARPVDGEQSRRTARRPRR